MKSIADIRLRYRAVLSCVIAGLIAMTSIPAFAEYPDRPVRIVVPYGPGNGIDLSARIIGQKLSEMWGQPVVIDNRPGASAILGTDLVAKAAADGYTLLITANTIAISAGGGGKLPFNLSTDFAPVTMSARAPLVFAVGTKVPVTTVKGLIELSRSRPGGINLGSAGQGGVLHLAMGLLKARSPLVATHVPYKTTAAAITDVVGGRVDGLFATTAVIMPQVEKGALRALAVSTSVRSKHAPGVPTMTEAGIANFNVSTWFGFLAPAGTPPAIIEKIQGDISKVVARREVIDTLDSQGLDAVSMTSDEFARLLRAEVLTWTALIKDAGIKLE